LVALSAAVAGDDFPLNRIGFLNDICAGTENVCFAEPGPLYKTADGSGMRLDPSIGEEMAHTRALRREFLRNKDDAMEVQRIALCTQSMRCEGIRHHRERVQCPVETVPSWLSEHISRGLKNSSRILRIWHDTPVR
jgi:hypothetical protein